ncbi:hypothetical protein NX059_006612 [Plenodomus lindquistii]|nr:hypothetical protein NX059_006612 [Plenodomus lindquistii]
MALAGNCSPAGIPLPTLFGAEFLSITASPVVNYTSPPASYINNGRAPTTPISFCNVTLTHTHPGYNDTLRTQIWLPLTSAWNGRFQMAAGGGWVAGYDAGSFGQMSGAVNDGYATSTVDAGVQTATSFTPEAWALKSPGNVDYNTLETFAYKSLHDGALATKSIIESFYGREPAYSYWNGCSQGGRQGYMFAQRFPEVFDGIAATAPAINWDKFFVASAYPGQVLRETGQTPNVCEYDTIFRAAIEACDGLDGLDDDIISHPDSCKFDPYSLVGKPATSCRSASPPGPSTISEAAASYMNALWNGVRTEDGTLLYPTADRSVNVTASGALVTRCFANSTCTATRNPLFGDWIRLFIEKDPNYNINNMTRGEFVAAFRTSVREYASIIGTGSTDLTEFKATGHKLLTWHGLADDLIPYANTRVYYDEVKRLDRKVDDYYRYFEAPGVAHCGGGPGGNPFGTFKALVAWVENGTAPNSLIATSPRNKTSLLCPYPKKAVFKGTSPDFSAKDFVCS